MASAKGAGAPLHVALAGSAYDGVGVPASIGSGRRAAREELHDCDVAFEKRRFEVAMVEVRETSEVVIVRQ